jgi:hypothetical protein
MSGMPVGTTSNAQVAGASLPAGERSNKTTIFISGVNETRAFLAWLRASCPSSRRMKFWWCSRLRPTVLELRSAHFGPLTGRTV